MNCPVAATTHYGCPAVEGVSAAFLALNRNKKEITLMLSPGKVERLDPELSEHNAAIYVGLLGVSEHEIDELQAEGVI